MLAIERKHRIQTILRDRKSASLDDLAAELGVSASTVRRDLESMESSGDIERTHGGVVWIGELDNARPYAFDARLSHAVEAKRSIAQAARTLVQPGQTILIDGGTTTLYLAEAIRGLHLQIVTNSLPVADLFSNDDRVELLLAGGLVYPRYGVLLGPMAEAALATIHTQTMFLSAAGIYEGNLYNQNLLLVSAEQRMMRQAQRLVLLVDSSKFGKQTLARLCPLSEIDVVVSDAGLTEENRAAVRDAGCELIVAPG